MAVTASNLMMGPVFFWFGDFGTTEPVDAEVDPGVGWTDAGGSLGGATLNLGQTRTPLRVDQVPMDVGSRLTNQECSVATQLAEPTLENLQLALNDTQTITDELEWGGEVASNSEPDYKAVMLRGTKPGGGPRMWIVRRCLSVETVGVPFSLDGQTVVPVTLKGYFVSQSIKAVRISDKPTTP